jgi:hypothetical protein
MEVYNRGVHYRGEQKQKHFPDGVQGVKILKEHKRKNNTMRKETTQKDVAKAW